MHFKCIHFLTVDIWQSDKLLLEKNCICIYGHQRSLVSLINSTWTQQAAELNCVCVQSSDIRICYRYNYTLFYQYIKYTFVPLCKKIFRIELIKLRSIFLISNCFLCFLVSWAISPHFRKGKAEKVPTITNGCHGSYNKRKIINESIKIN